MGDLSVSSEHKSFHRPEGDSLPKDHRVSRSVDRLSVSPKEGAPPPLEGFSLPKSLYADLQAHVITKRVFGDKTLSAEEKLQRAKKLTGFKENQSIRRILKDTRLEEGQKRLLDSQSLAIYHRKVEITDVDGQIRRGVGLLNTDIAPEI